MRRMIRKKIKSSYGETLVETLAALLVAVLALIMLPGAITSAAKANKAAAERSVFNTSTTEEVGNLSVSMTVGSATDSVGCIRHEVKVNEESRDLYYYEVETD